MKKVFVLLKWKIFPYFFFAKARRFLFFSLIIIKSLVFVSLIRYPIQKMLLLRKLFFCPWSIILQFLVTSVDEIMILFWPLNTQDSKSKVNISIIQININCFSFYMKRMFSNIFGTFCVCVFNIIEFLLPGIW